MWYKKQDKVQEEKIDFIIKLEDRYFIERYLYQKRILLYYIYIYKHAIHKSQFSIFLKKIINFFMHKTHV